MKPAVTLTIILSALMLGACQQHSPATVAAIPAPKATAPAVVATAAPDANHPVLRVTTFDGQTYDLAAQRGHWVLVNFWATWCGPCLQEMPELAAFAKSRKDVAVIGLDYEDIERPQMEAFLRQHDPGYPIAIIDPYKPMQYFEAPRGLPTSYLIDPDGKIVKPFLGPITIKDLEQAIDHAGKPPA